jgi:hypothetical protein
MKKTIAVAILDRLVNAAQLIQITGESLRKKLQYCHAHVLCVKKLNQGVSITGEGSASPEYAPARLADFYDIW